MLDGLLGIGDPANPGGDPGKPLAALVAIDRAQDHCLQLSGGWNHDALLGRGSFKPWYGKPLVLTVIKRPGPMRTTTHFYINGEQAAATVGRDTVPDIRHRADIGLYMGKALAWAGSFKGDVGEAIVFDRALSESHREGIETYLSEKFSIEIASQIAATRASFTADEKQHWAFQPIAKTPPPTVKNPAWIKTPIDSFVLDKLEAAGLSPAPAAEKRELIRRATYDLTGLPPKPAEIEAFLKDDSPTAFASLVDRLLASPHYGERWGRHWLDVVRYADTTANDANAVMHHAWRYRNYVIDAFNRDLPYDEFLVEQLAGDLLPPANDAETRLRRIIATGYLLVGPKALAETDKEQSRLDIVDDQIDVTGRAMLGMTLACARCHDHKFDPIRTVDYYAMAGILRSTEPFQDEVRNATMWWEFPVPGPQGQPVTVMAPKEAAPINLRVHVRGNRFTLGQAVPRGFMQILAPEPATIEPGHSGRLELARWITSPGNPLTARVMVNRVWQHHFGRGLVASSDNFGKRGDKPTHPELLDWLAAQFVESGWKLKDLHRLMLLSSTYQQQCRPGDRASQLDAENQLLSWFPRRRLDAEELRDSVLMIAGSLDLAPGADEAVEVAWKQAEVTDAKRGFVVNRMAADDPFYTSYTKRSVYLPIIRNMLPDVLALFDAADPNGVTAARNDTTVPSQALFLLNSQFMREQSDRLAARLLANDKASDEQRLGELHELVFGRPPSAGEVTEAREYLTAYLAAPAALARPEPQRRQAAWQSYCQSLFCENEFLYCN